MIEQILLTSSKHQSYRRAAQIVMLEFFGYDINKVDVIWALHRDYHSEQEVIDSFVEMGAKHVAEYPNKYAENHPYRSHSHSAMEAKARAFVRIIETGKNTIILEDDHYLIMQEPILSEKLKNLHECVSEKIGVVQLNNRGATRNSSDPYPIAKATDITRGCYRSSHTALYVTPYGAEKLLDFIRDPATREDIENALPKELGNEDWVFSVLHPEQFVFSSTYIQGDCIGLRYTRMGIDNRRTEENMQTLENILERFRL